MLKIVVWIYNIFDNTFRIKNDCIKLFVGKLFVKFLLTFLLQTISNRALA